jgi:hypothetical protein
MAKRTLISSGAMMMVAAFITACTPPEPEAEAPSVQQASARLAMCGEGLAEGCVQSVSDTTGLIYTATDGGYDFRLLALEDGAELQSFDEEHGNAMSAPSLEDLDQDGDPELIIPDFTGNVNTVYRIRQLIDGRFEPAGEVSGLGLERDEETGLLGISSRGSAVQYAYHAYVLSDDGLVLAYELDSDLADRACVLTPGPAFDATGLDANELLTACEAAL